MTSKIAQNALVQISKKQQRKQKGLIDKMSAAIILQDYMNSLS
jgi:RNase H-fold protein (predicted Holliday junction resolvase)